MTTVQALLAFVAAASILTLTPGVDTAMVLRSAASGVLGLRSMQQLV
jgi:threonine/homoserine/homoserine lactone efflux protein